MVARGSDQPKADAVWSLSVIVLGAVTAAAVVGLAIIILIGVLEDKPYYEQQRTGQLNEQLTNPLNRDSLGGTVWTTDASAPAA